MKDINWDFYKGKKLSTYDIQPFNCRKYHWYPGTFIPEIPFTIIEILTKPRAVVYDPFGGIGTSYFQALLLGRKPVTTEICQVATEYMKSIFMLFDPEIDLQMVKNNIVNKLYEFSPNIDYTQKIPKHILIDKLRPWFSNFTLTQLSFLFFIKDSFDDVSTRSAIQASISAIIKTASSQDRGWGCVADNVLPKSYQIKDKNALDLFRKQVIILLNDIDAYSKLLTNDFIDTYKKICDQMTIYNEDVRNCAHLRDNSVDLVVTSPPYPNMTDYITSQRLSYYYYGIDPIKISNKKNEIGARGRRFKSDSLNTYLSDMQRANKVIARKMKTGGFACFVMPAFNIDNDNNRKRKEVVNKVISNLEEIGLVVDKEFERMLPTKRRSHNIKWATLERETIYLIRKV